MRGGSGPQSAVKPVLQEVLPYGLRRLGVARTRNSSSQGDIAKDARNPRVVLPFCRLILRAALPSAEPGRVPRTVGEHLLKWRRDLGHTQEQVAEAAFYESRSGNFHH